MKVKILSMILLNFKGVRTLNIKFNDVTNISGDNGTGKTSVFDAFTWCMFGKNSEDAKDFNVKTLDAFNKPIHKLEHEVTVTLEADGREYKFRRMMKEKWVTKKGEPVAEFTGHETFYFVDDVPLSQKEYQARVDFVINENIAKMITSPTYFNSLKWQERRGVLEAMAGTISNEEIAGNNAAFRDLLSKLNGEPLADFKKRIGAKKTILKNSIATLPTRIDEAQRSKPEPEDWDGIQKRIAAKKTALEGVEAAMADKTKAYELEYEAIRKKQQQKHELETKLDAAKHQTGATKRKKIAELQSELDRLQGEIKTHQQKIESTNRIIAGNKERIASLTKRNDEIRAQWNTENAKTLTIDVHALDCPTCKQALPEAERESIREKMTSNFNASKKAKLDDLNKQGTANKATIEELTKDNSTLESLNGLLHSDNIETLQQKIEATKEDITSVQAWPEGESAEVTELQKQISEFVIPTTPAIDNAELKSKKEVLNAEISDLKEILSGKAQIEKADARIKELSDEEARQAQELADLERMEFTIAEFSKAKIETIEARTNGKFKLVKFKMFSQNINGGEEECCECMVNGVPYSDVNTAGKINAGLDIINALTEHYNVSAPVFIDNRESVIEILDCASQIINLRAVEGLPLMIDGTPSEFQNEKGKLLLVEWKKNNYQIAA
jgi:DNA repair protein SbcC/Rad50